MFTKNGFFGMLCLVLALLLIAPAALAATGDTVLFEQDTRGYSSEGVEWALALGDTLYITTWDNLYTYKMGDAEPTKVCPLREEVPPLPAGEEYPPDYQWPARMCCPISYQGKLYFLNEENGKLNEYQDGKFTETEMLIKKPDTGEEGYSISGSFVTLFEFEDKLFALARPDANNWELTELWVIDPQTGDHQTIKTEQNIRGLCGYLPGKLLCWTQPEWTQDMKVEDYVAKLFVLDIASGKAQGDMLPIEATAGTWNGIYGLTYDPATQKILFGVQNKLMSMSALDAKAEVVSYFNRDLYQTNGQPAILAGTHLVLPGYDGVFIRNIAESKFDGRVLKVANGWMSQAASAFMKQNPDTPLEFVQIDSLNSAGVDEIITKIGSGDGAIDILRLWDTSKTKPLMEKGYAMDLGESEALRKAFDRMYPAIRDAMSMDGKFFTFPSEMNPSMWRYNKAKFEEIGIEFPETYVDLIDLMEKWDDELAEQYPEFSLMDGNTQYSENEKTMMFSRILSTYMQETVTPDAPVRFDSPEFREAIQRTEQMAGEYQVPGESTSVTNYSEEYKPSLMYSYFDLEYYDTDSGAVDMHYPPRVSASVEPAMNMSYGVYIVNPNSPNKDLALKYLEYLAENNDKAIMISMYPDCNEPMEEQWAVEQLEETEKWLEELRATEITPENQRDTEQSIKDAEEQLKRMEARRWRISPETIEQYRNFAEHMTLSGNEMGMLSNETTQKEFMDVMTRYMQGQLNLDQMIREMDQKMQMIFLEQQ